jgi:hypothetical protein
MAEWQTIESAPKKRKVIAGYWNDHGKWRTITARYYVANSLDDYTGDEESGYAPEGWYEEYESNEEIYPCRQPTHWMPLPTPPVQP